MIDPNFLIWVVIFETLNMTSKDGGAFKDLELKPGTDRHHLITRRALNLWCEYLGDRAPSWLKDPEQGWAPAIRMSKEDHAKTPSYYNKDTMTRAQLAVAGQYINEQREALIKGDICKCFETEIEHMHRIFGDKYASALNSATDYFLEFIQTHQLPGPVSIEEELREIHEELDEIKAMLEELLDRKPARRY